MLKVVLTNDDGIEAEGLAALEEACRGWSELIVAAPDRCHSSMSHHVNTAEPIGVTEVLPGRFRVTASPADCARLARMCLAKEADWLISGINHGGNLGMDTCYSGTVAAAREAALLGLPAIAISHFVVRGRALDWSAASRRAKRVIGRLMEEGLAPGSFWNVNLPHPEAGEAEPELVFCPLDQSALPVAYRLEEAGYRYTGSYPSRARAPGTDVALCFGGAITATLLSVRGGM